MEIINLTPQQRQAILESLDQTLLDTDGRIRLLKAEDYRGIDRTELRFWCHIRARYFLPTQEAIAWLKEQIGDRTAIEVGAGNGDLGYHLGIPATDSYIQHEPDVRAYYQAIRQPITNPPPDVERLDALAAIQQYNPQVVVAAWLTHKYKEGVQAGSVYGVEEEKIVDRVQSYIHIGNYSVHEKKPALALEHKELWFPWLVSRSQNPGSDVVFVWGQKDGK